MRRDKKTLEPVMLDTTQVCQLLGIGSSSFYEKQKALRDLGFPSKHPVLQRYHREAVERWARETSGLALAEPETTIEF